MSIAWQARTRSGTETVPHGWTVRRVGDLIALTNGFPFPSESFGPTGDIPLVRIRDLGDAPFETFVSGRVPVSALVRNGDVIIGMDGDFNLAIWRKGEAALNQRLCALRPRPDVDIRFIAYFLPSSLKIINDLTFSTTVKHLSSTDVLSERIALPPLPEQRRIADFLDAETARIDRLIAASQRQSDSMSERLTEFLRQMTTTAGDRVTMPTGIAWMPAMAAGWRLLKIGRSFTSGSGTTPRSSESAYFGGEHNWVNTGDLRDRVIERPNKTVTDRALAEYPTLKIYAPGSLVVAMYGATTGRVGILGVPACVNQACCVLSELGPLDSQYAFFWFRAHREELLKLASGGGQPNISQDLVRSLRIPAPCRSVQQEVVRRAIDLETVTARQKAYQKRRADLLAERRQALITAAVTGQFDVSTAGGRNVTEGITA
ncbi:restriction endonuclease subunit S [Streptomyces benahoarensis]|uniref:Type I restriction modification DNA specificity domain-containing protein n=1 Tax=Streptomyces benahoarensis TaxID=2595054 RepID=A0A553ZL61_9ACTN|nr:restriction endonuclease subunit S [Streptomyces benahoarensis]TSB26627.1 hypothetical protein FNJ62_11055 [Streptomyces benahoarensis]TSB42167.1 hypothetical protein FNZ23_11310 [Streptomyces benahoarensis]